MRVAYVVGWPEGPTSGPFKKVRAQTAAWAAEGVDVGLFVLTVEDFAADWSALPAARCVLTRARGPQLAWQKEALIRDASRWNPDVIYHRWALTYPGLLRAARSRPVVLEINTDDVIEYDLMTPMKGRVNRLTRGLALSSAAGLAFVTRELQQGPAFARYDRPSVVIANGIDVASVPQLAAPRNPRPRLLFIGQPGCPWHGVDKLAEFAGSHPDWDFDVVGPPRSEVPYPPPNIVFRGLLDDASYTRLLATADIGIGTLALHRKGMDEASPLKVREYLAAGLPVVNACLDTDFPSGAEFLLCLPNTETNMRTHAAEVEAFVSSWLGRRVPREQVAHLDHAAKERSRLEFFRSLR